MDTDAHWKKIGRHHHHGISLPLFSLRSQNSCGVGEFLDLLPLIDWCNKIGFDCIQLLPLCESANDPSPYNAISSCALDPIYLSIRALSDSDLEHFIPLNQSERLKREEVKNQKMKWLRAYFEKEFESVKGTEKYQKFLSENKWLSTFALFTTLKIEFHGKVWTHWPREYEIPRSRHFETRQTEIDFHSFIQYLCFDQMETVKKRATEKGVLIKGDIPILLSADSADVWEHRSSFRVDLSAGAPPDYYNSEGQYWGFPLFNWQTMREDGFSWWKQRLQVAEKFFHLYRIDHAVGFFRIWAIPLKKSPSNGFFVPEDETLWMPQGKELLEMMIHSSSLLPIAEDLGIIPEGVYPILKKLGICGTKVLRWQRYPTGNKSYIPYDQYEPLSMTTVSTHDTEPVGLWWKKYPEEAVPFAAFKHWDYNPTITQKQRFEILMDSHRTPSYFHINLLGEYLALFPDLVWQNPEEERINTPGTLLPTNWSYRFRPHLEEIISHEGLTDTMKKFPSVKSS